MAPGPLADLLRALYLLHLRGGEPSMRELAGRTRLLSHDTVHRVLTRSETPRWRPLELVVTALGGDVEQFRDLWVAARLAEAGQDPMDGDLGDARTEAVGGRRAVGTGTRAGPSTSSRGARIRRQGGDRTRVLVVDRHPLWRREVATQLTAAGCEVVATVGEMVGAVREARARAPHVVVAGMDQPDASGARLCRQLRAGEVAAPVLVFSASRSPQDVRQALAAGASGYVHKSSTREELIDAVRRTAAGERVFSPGLASDSDHEPLTSRDAPAPGLTARETEILSLVARGSSYREVAQRLGVSVRTVQLHVQRLLEKLGLHSRIQLVRYAVEHGLVDGTVMRA
ncbi:response regulator [Streptomyces sp. NPDC059010]|uniref:response regulator n=1 Tax=Streptomyces sp. NPDC059010 TaxID=3346695 RepID=UPI0036B4595C